MADLSDNNDTKHHSSIQYSPFTQCLKCVVVIVKESAVYLPTLELDKQQFERKVSSKE